MAESGVIRNQNRMAYEVNHNTETGMTDAQKAKVLNIESSIRNNKNESMHIVDDGGYEVLKYQGRGAKVQIPKNEETQTKAAIKDHVFTHNHPRSIGKTGISSIGNSFSPQDVSTAIWGDARELRAVTPRYTFSMKRPADGWGMPAAEAMSLYKMARRKVTKEGRQYLDQNNWDQESQERANTLLAHQVNKEFVRMAKRLYGVNITYRHKRG